MAFETLHSLYTSLLLGRWPDWPEHSIVSAGEELREVIREKLPELDEFEADHERIGEALIAFGALAPDDNTTGLADLIEALLPPANQP